MKWLITLIALTFSAHSLHAATHVALTIDDLPAAGDPVTGVSRMDVAKSIIESLRKAKLEGVYGFVNGIAARDMSERYEILKLWRDAKHFVGNHTYSHKDLSLSPSDEFIADIEKNESILIDYAGSISELKWFRYPYLHEGDTKEKRYAVRSYLARRDYKIAQVSIDFEDWAWNGPYNRCLEKNDKTAIEKLESTYLETAIKRLKYSDQLAKKIYGAKREIKHVLLIHFNAFSARMIPRLIESFKKEGVDWVSSLSAMNDPIYKEDTSFIGTGKTFFMQAQEARSLVFRDLSQPQVPKDWLNKVCL